MLTRDGNSISATAARRPFFLAVLAVAALSLGEVGASVRVETPKWESFGKLIFDRMHYGVGNDLAALCLLLLIVVLLGGIAVAVLARLVISRGEAGWRLDSDLWLWLQSLLKLGRGM